MFEIQLRYQFGILLILGLLFSTKLASQPGVSEQLALQYYQDGEYVKSAELFLQIYKSAPSTYFYNYTLNSLLRANDLKGAEKFVKSVSAANPNSVKYQVEIAYIIEVSGEHDKAEKIYKKLISKAPVQRNYYTELADAFQVREKHDFAEEVLIKGLKKFEPPLYFELADYYSNLGKSSQAIGVYLDMIEDQDRYIEVVKNKLQLAISDEGKSNFPEALRDELLRRHEKTGKTIYQELLFWFSVQMKEFDLALIQAKSLDKLFNESGDKVYQLTNILVSNAEYQLAIDGYEYLLKLGEANRFFRNAEVNILIAKFETLVKNGKITSEDLLKLVDDYEKIIGKYGRNTSTYNLLFNLAHIKAFYLHDTKGAEEILESMLLMSGLKQEQIAEVKMELGDALLFEGRIWSASLLYKQVEKMFKDDEIGFDARFRSAKFFYYVGEMEYAKVQLDVLKGATSKLIANDAMELSLLIQENLDPDSTYSSLEMFSKADLMVYQKKSDDALKTLDSILQIFPGFPIIDDVIFKKAQLFALNGDLQKSIENYELIISGYSTESTADNAIWELAHIFEHKTGDIEKAKKLYEKMILEFPGSIFINDSRKKYNELKNKSSK